ncbi:expressed unknown protein [Seminavis robusta]|uniref:Glycosyltransferase 2-like domain-containing protein n=1 Tax=Seminavis robusta TaxID=568900 RepID=A0A9N8H9F3_9STRA|nr:expressed unknown protein [Seminavis robusta]|eukprot:Sro273_g105210.1 n/a (847) ;mRNA; f:63028-65760
MGQAIGSLKDEAFVQDYANFPSIADYEDDASSDDEPSLAPSFQSCFSDELTRHLKKQIWRRQVAPEPPEGGSTYTTTHRDAPGRAPSGDYVDDDWDDEEALPIGTIAASRCPEAAPAPVAAGQPILLLEDTQSTTAVGQPILHKDTESTAPSAAAAAVSHSGDWTLAHGEVMALLGEIKKSLRDSTSLTINRTDSQESGDTSKVDEFPTWSMDHEVQVNKMKVYPDNAKLGGGRRSFLNKTRSVKSKKSSKLKSIFKKDRNMNDQSIPTFDANKKKNRQLRWNLLWALGVFGTILGLGFAPLWMDKVWGCQQSWIFTSTIFTIMDLVFLVSAILAWPNLYAEVIEFFHTNSQHRYLQTSELTPSGQHINKNAMEEELNPDTGVPTITHLVVMTGYKEPVDLIAATLDTVAAQTRAKSIIMVIGWEERTPDYESKMEFFHNRYGHSFFRLIQTVHPYGLKGEIAGTCSNANWAVRQSTTTMRDEGMPLDPDTTLLTKLDTDTMFLPTHFDVLQREFMKLPKHERLDRMYQSVLSFNLGLDERWFFTRVTGILRTFFILGFLVPYNISAMSIYSMSLSLARRGNYWLPHYQMEDVIQNLNLMSSLGKRVKINLIPLPTISGPTSGETFRKELFEWRWQARRWTVGSAEVYHYYVVKFLKGKLGFWRGLEYGFCYVLYYGAILCVIGLYQFCATIAVSFDTCNQDRTSFLWPILMVLKYTVVFGTAFLADYIHRKIIGVEEKALQGLWGWIRSIFHWLSAPLVLLAYNIVEAVAIIELSYYGRDICGHDASDKGALVGGGGSDSQKQAESKTEELEVDCARKRSGELNETHAEGESGMPALVAMQKPGQ